MLSLSCWLFPKMLDGVVLPYHHPQRSFLPPLPYPCDFTPLGHDSLLASYAESEWARFYTILTWMLAIAKVAHRVNGSRKHILIGAIGFLLVPTITIVAGPSGMAL